MGLGKCFVLCAGVAALLSATAGEVIPRHLYEISFRARVVHGPTFDESPHYREVLPYCDSDPKAAGIPFASVRWQVFDRKDGTLFERSRLFPYGITVASREWRTYRTKVFIPDGVTWLEVCPVVGQKGDELAVEGVQVREVDRGDTLNINPDMQWAAGCLTGWKLDRDAYPELAEPGRTRMYVEEGWSLSEPFPVEPGMTFALTMRGAPCVHDRYQNRVGCNVYFTDSYAALNDLNKKAVKAVTRLLVFDDEGTKTENYRVPVGMKWAVLSPSYGTVDYLGAKEVR